ncbi:L-ascorbate 6-phosphate lactonase [uncultured Sphaerochaeta sp.]|uniref:L-ascorbate 6-phosphate lactonase n=1 Tax=uncultured Sphaerochaeta sp. TaxID=886478 RepID=UPI002A0A753F|nr:L-ascorbate 6-phosphate lactonase [uncultured Sphaerochaeta sp.]
MSKVDEITKESWIRNSCPEWGTWLNEEIDNEIVPAGNVAMWWLGCTGLWVKTPENCNISIDFWCGNGKRTKKAKDMVAGHQMANMCGGRLLQPNRRAIPFVLDPFEVRHVDAVLATHYHADHMDPNYASAVLHNIEEKVPFIGPKESVRTWIEWGVPADRCITVRPGDVIKIKDMEIHALDSFDRTCLVTTPGYVDIRDTCPNDMDDKAVNYLIKTPGGNIYHSGDSHYSIYFAKHGKDNDIDVAFGSYGENPVGIADKMTSCDILRMAEALRCKVVIPVHYDIWTNFMADPHEIEVLYDMKKYRLDYGFHPFIWEVGGKYVYPRDKERRQYHHDRGFSDCFEQEPNTPFRSIL